MDKSQTTHSFELPKMRSHPRFGPVSATGRILSMVVLHIALSLLMRNFRILATTHALIVFGIGAYKAMTADDMKQVVPYAAYIMGAEVLWRMAKANIFWEFGKYAIAAIFIIALLKRRRIEKAGWPLLFFVVLTPSIIYTINAFGLSERTRGMISFNLSGAFVTSIAIIFFRQIKIQIDEIKNWIWPAVYPILGILTLAAFNTITATEIDFGSESVFITSGGYGPNQVSAILGLGALLLVMLAISQEKKSGRLLGIIFALALITQSFLTFSRGGIYNFAIGLTGAIMHLLGKPDKFIKGVFVVLIIATIVGIFILPQLDIFTGGTLTQRFSDMDTTGRQELAIADLRLFQQNPVLGVGPGMSSFLRLEFTHIAAHTEYTRIIAEHGSAGVIALLILLIILATGYFKAPDAMTRAWVVAFAAWPMVEMAHAAMRVASISFMLGITAINWHSEQELASTEEDATP